MKFIEKYIDKYLEKKVAELMERRWEERYENLVVSGETTEKNCRDEVKRWLETAKLQPLLGSIRAEIRDYVDNHLKT